MSHNVSELKLPSGATIKIRDLSSFEVRFLLLNAMFEGFVEPGRYVDKIKGGKFDIKQLMIFDIEAIEQWAAKTPLERIEEKIVSP